MIVKWLLLAGFYLWLGFTVGYFFRKWLEVSYLPRYREAQWGPHRTPAPPADRDRGP